MHTGPVSSPLGSMGLTPRGSEARFSSPGRCVRPGARRSARWISHCCAPILVGLACSLAGPATGAEPAPQEAEAAAGSAGADQEVTKARNLYPLAEEVSGGRLGQKRNEYLRTRKWVLGYSRQNPGSAYLGWGEAAIHAGTADVKFGQSRVLAYETALMEAQGEFVRAQQRATTTEALREFLDDAGNVAEGDVAKEASRLKVIGEKLLALTEAKLDEGLAKAGVDPAQFRDQSPEVRRTLLRDAISRSVKVRAMQSLAGLRVLATFEDLETVGVLIVYSDKQRELARDIAAGRTVARSSGAMQRESILMQIEEMCPHGAKDLVHAFGVRVMQDENGVRVLVSFGQWSPAITQMDSRLRRDSAIKAARAHAMNLADGALTDVVNSTLALETDSAIWQNAEVNQVISGKNLEEVESLAIGESVRNALKQHGRATMQGVVSIKEWSANHPETGHLIVGQVLMWSPSSRDAARHGLNQAPPAQTKPGATRTHENRVRVSPDFDKDADF